MAGVLESEARLLAARIDAEIGALGDSSVAALRKTRRRW